MFNNLSKVKLKNLTLHDLAVAYYKLGINLYKHKKYDEALYY